MNYPLKELLIIKQKRFDQAVKLLEEKKALLDKEEKKLYDLTRERDEVLFHKKEKVDKLRSSLDEGTTSRDVEQQKTYLKVVEGKLLEKEKKVEEQKKVVSAAKKQVEIATDEMFLKKKDVEKLEMHKTEWQKETRYATEQKEALEQDDQGSATHLLKKKKLV